MGTEIIELIDSGGTVVVLAILIRMLFQAKLIPANTLKLVVAMTVAEVLKALGEEVKPG